MPDQTALLADSLFQKGRYRIPVVVNIAAECKDALERRAPRYCDDERAAIREICHLESPKTLVETRVATAFFLDFQAVSA